jgi:hypothetical protein
VTSGGETGTAVTEEVAPNRARGDSVTEAPARQSQDEVQPAQLETRRKRKQEEVVTKAVEGDTKLGADATAAASGKRLKTKTRFFDEE